MNCNQPLISIIIPVYNVASYLPRCLDSVCKQTYQNLEIILIDDGSTDNGLEICNQYAAKDKRVHIFHQENKGVSAARNLGLKQAGGEWITFVDGDDWIVPHYVTRLFNLAEAYRTDIAIARLVKCRNKQVPVFPPPPYRKARLPREQCFIEPVHDTPLNIASKLYRKTLLKGILFDTSCQVGEDIFFFFDALSRVKMVASTDEPLYVYCRREDSAMACSAVLMRMANFKLWRKINEPSWIQDNEIHKKMTQDCMIRAAAALAVALLLEPGPDKHPQWVEENFVFLQQHRAAIRPCDILGFPGKTFILTFLTFPKTVTFLCRIEWLRKILIKIAAKRLAIH